MSLQHHQILRLPRKVTLIIDPLHTWNVISNKRSNKSQPPTSANTAPATQNDTHNQSSSHMKRYLQCAEEQVSLSKLTKYCACHEKWISSLILVTHETLFTMRGGTSVIVQTHQILRLPRKMNLMIDPCHTWKAIYNARSNKCHCPNSPNTAPATKNESHDWSLSHMKRYLQCAEEQVSLSKLTKYCACHEKWISWLILVTHERLSTMRGATSVIVQTHQILRLPRKMNLMIDPCHTWNAIYNARSNKCHCPNSPNILRLPRKMTLQNFAKISRKQLKRHFQCGADPRMIREWSENETVTPQPASQARLLFALATSIFYWKIQHFALRLSFQISPNTAPTTKSDTSTSPNTAPATQNDSHHWSSWHVTRHLQCAAQQHSPSDLTKYCACHAKWNSWLISMTYETLFTMRGTTGGILQHHQLLRLPRKMILQNFRNISPKQMKRQLQCATDPSWIRAGSDHDPTMIREWNRHPQPASQPRLLFKTTTSILYWKIQHFALRLSFQISPNTAPATKSDTSTSPNTPPATQNDCHDTVMTDPRHIWNAIYNARNNRWHPPTSPNSAPATQNDSPTFQRNFLKTAETSFPMRGRSENDPSNIRATSEQETVRRNPPRNRGYFSGPPRAFCIEKYNISRSGYHSKFHRILRLPRKVTLQLHRILRLPRKMTVMILSWLILVTYETLFTMRGTTGGILQHHQILRLPRKMTVMTDPRHIWNAIYNARNNRWHPPTSPNTAPATQNDSPKFQKHFSKTDETSITMRDREWFELDPSWKPSSATRLATEVTFQDHHEHFVLKNTTFRAPAIIPNFTEYCACHEKWHFNFTEYCACHEKWHLNVTK